MISDLEGVLLHQFSTPTQFGAFVEVIEGDTASDLPLPRFNRLLGCHDGIRAHHKENSDIRHQLPERANTTELKDPATLCKFASMKLLYEHGFAQWLTEQKTETVQRWIRQALDEGKARAQKLLSKSPYCDQIQAKAESLPGLGEGGLVGLFDDLSREIAIELRHQNAYEPDPEKARDASDWIEDFKCYLLLIAFPKFLQKRQFDWLLQLEARAKPDKNRADLKEKSPQSSELASQPDSENEPWRANLYFFLHLVPVDDVARLIHQFRKTATLETKEQASVKKTAGDGTDKRNDTNKRDDTDKGDANDEDVKVIQEILSLYMDMANDKFEGGATSVNASEFASLFECTSDFEKIYTLNKDAANGPQDQLLISAHRGLREIRRFGHMRVLEDIFKSHKVTPDDVKTFLDMTKSDAGGTSKIEKSQSERQELHQKLATARGPISATGYEDYRTLVEQISQFRDCAARVRLTDHVRLHQLVMRVVSRLLDYAGTWERDRLFVFIALINAQKEQGEHVANPAPDAYPMRNDLVKRFESAERWDKEMEWLTDDNKQLFIQHFNNDISSVRNDFAHFNILAAEQLPLDLTHQINRTRDLMSYDRKLKNAVSKSIKELLQREGLQINWTMNDHKLQLGRITPKMIRHLHGKKVDSRGRINPIMEQLHSRSFVAMTEAVFAHKNAKSATE